MYKRTSIINYTNVINVSLSSVCLIGDSKQITPRAKALAVQRQLQFFYGNEGNFDQFAIFKKEIPIPTWGENLTFQTFHHSPFIKVNHVHVISVAASSIYQIGSTNDIDAESRVKHIRQLLDDQNRRT